MFDSTELKQLRQDVDALGAQIEVLQETLETRHIEIMEKLEALSTQIEDTQAADVTQDDIEDLKATVENVGSEVEDVAQAVHDIEEKLDDAS